MYIRIALSVLLIITWKISIFRGVRLKKNRGDKIKNEEIRNTLNIDKLQDDLEDKRIMWYEYIKENGATKITETGNEEESERKET